MLLCELTDIKFHSVLSLVFPVYTKKVFNMYAGVCKSLLLNKFMLQTVFHLNTQNTSKIFCFCHGIANKLKQSQNDIFQTKIL